MTLYGETLFFMRRSTKTAIHPCFIREEGGKQVVVTGCDRRFDRHDIPDDHIAQRPDRLPGPLMFCRRCPSRHEKLSRICRGKQTGGDI